jgi:uncharacterized membrane protein YeaQ/YmgE (transglycosylase-associated protein family)
LIWLIKEKLKRGEGSFNEGFELLAGICLLLRMVKTAFGVRCELRGLTTIHMLHIVWSIIVGFIVGLLASAIMHTHLGFVLTTLLGIVGSVVGGLIARLFSRPPEGSKFHAAGFLMSIVGAIVVVFLVRLVG